MKHFFQFHLLEDAIWKGLSPGRWNAVVPPPSSFCHFYSFSPPNVFVFHSFTPSIIAIFGVRIFVARWYLTKRQSAWVPELVICMWKWQRFHLRRVESGQPLNHILVQVIATFQKRARLTKELVHLHAFWSFVTWYAWGLVRKCHALVMASKVEGVSLVSNNSLSEHRFVVQSAQKMIAVGMEIKFSERPCVLDTSAPKFLFYCTWSREWRRARGAGHAPMWQWTWPESSPSNVSYGHDQKHCWKANFFSALLYCHQVTCSYHTASCFCSASSTTGMLKNHLHMLLDLNCLTYGMPPASRGRTLPHTPHTQAMIHAGTIGMMSMWSWTWKCPELLASPTIGR